MLRAGKCDPLRVRAGELPLRIPISNEAIPAAGGLSTGDEISTELG